MTFEPQLGLLPREDRINWHDAHMLHAIIAAMRSPDPNTQVGACIVKDNVPISWGYNGTPRGISPKLIPWDRASKNKFGTKYPYIVHAEENAIFNARGQTKDTVLYITLFPCSECSKSVIQSGIKSIYYLADLYHDTEDAELSRWLLEIAGVQTQYYPLEIQPEQIMSFIRNMKGAVWQ